MQVSTEPIKQRALGFPEPVKSLILSEPDSMDAKELISKIGTWDRLLMLQKGGK